MYIPYYLCPSIRHTLFEEGCTPLFYHIDDNFMPYTNLNISKYILYPNYFGICDKNVQKLALKFTNLIVDNAHAYYSQPTGFASFNAAYKFQEGNFSTLWIKGMNYTEPNALYKAQRQKAFLHLDDIYRKTNLLYIDHNSHPFCYPYLAKTTDEANQLAIKLKNKGKIIYRYWHSLPNTYNEYKFYSRLVPIPLI